MSYDVHKIDLYKSCFLVVGTAGLWGLVNNAGVLHLLPLEWTPLDVFKHTADVNLWGMIDVTKTFLPLVKKARGRIVNFSSAAGKLPSICFEINKNSCCNYSLRHRKTLVTGLLI